MEPIYLGDLVPSIASSKKIIEKYYKVDVLELKSQQLNRLNQKYS